MNKRGQFQAGFHWIYVMIAGGIILLFLFGFGMRFKETSEQALAQDVVGLLENIMTASRSAQKQIRTTNIKTLADYTLELSCEEEVSTLGLREFATRYEDNIDPLFGPARFVGDSMISWSLPFEFPYRVNDFLLLATDATQIVFVGSDGFVEEFMDATQFAAEEKGIFDREVVNSLTEIKSSNSKVLRIVDVSGTVQFKGKVPKNVAKAKSATAVSFGVSGANFYTMTKEKKWRSLKPSPLPIVSLGGDRDAAKIAMIFSTNPKSYWCGMEQGLSRFEHVTRIHTGKIETYLKSYPDPTSSCGAALVQAQGVITNTITNARACYENKVCNQVIQTASALATINDELEVNGCATIY